MSQATKAYRASQRRDRISSTPEERVARFASRIPDQEMLDQILEGTASMRRQMMLEMLRPHLRFTPQE